MGLEAEDEVHVSNRKEGCFKDVEEVAMTSPWELGGLVVQTVGIKHWVIFCTKGASPRHNRNSPMGSAHL